MSNFDEEKQASASHYTVSGLWRNVTKDNRSTKKIGESSAKIGFAIFATFGELYSLLYIKHSITAIRISSQDADGMQMFPCKVLAGKMNQFSK